MSIVATNDRFYIRLKPDFVADTLVELDADLATYEDKYVQVTDQSSKVYWVQKIQGVLTRSEAYSFANYDVTRADDVTKKVTYDDNFVSGQIVYIDDGVAYAVTRLMPESVLNLLGVVKVSNVGGSVEEVAVGGIVTDPSYLLSPGYVYLGDDGFPTSMDNSAEFYVPIGHAATSNTFVLASQPRYFR